MRRLFAMLTVCAAIVASAPARAASDDTVIDYFTPENVTEVMKDMGATDISTRKEEKFTAVDATINGQIISLGIQQCKDRPGCMGLLVAGVFSTDGKDIPAQTLLDFTGKYPPTPAILLSNKDVAVVRAIISLGGIRVANLKYNIGLLVGTLPIFAQQLNTALISSNGTAPTPYAMARVHPTHMAPIEMQQRLNILTDSMAASLARWPAPIRR